MVVEAEVSAGGRRHWGFGLYTSVRRTRGCEYVHMGHERAVACADSKAMRAFACRLRTVVGRPQTGPMVGPSAVGPRPASIRALRPSGPLECEATAATGAVVLPLLSPARAAPLALTPRRSSRLRLPLLLSLLRPSAHPLARARPLAHTHPLAHAHPLARTAPLSRPRRSCRRRPRPRRSSRPHATPLALAARTLRPTFFLNIFSSLPQQPFFYGHGLHVLPFFYNRVYMRPPCVRVSSARPCVSLSRVCAP